MKQHINCMRLLMSNTELGIFCPNSSAAARMDEAPQEAGYRAACRIAGANISVHTGMLGTYCKCHKRRIWQAQLTGRCRNRLTLSNLFEQSSLLVSAVCSQSPSYDADDADVPCAGITCRSIRLQQWLLCGWLIVGPGLD